jgi:hypothetical protein
VVLANGRLCAERVILGTRPSSSCWRSYLLGEEFLSAPIYSPHWSLVRSFNWYQSQFGSFGTLTSLRSKDDVPGMGVGSSALRLEELPDVAEMGDCVPSWQGTDPLGHYGEHNLCSSD